jgi:hypothetical protein
LENTEENCEMIWKIWMKCEMIWKIWKKNKLKSGKIWKIMGKSKMNSDGRGGGGLFGCNYD